MFKNPQRKIWKGAHQKLKMADTFGKGAEIGVTVVKRVLAFSVTVRVLEGGKYS